MTLPSVDSLARWGTTHDQRGSKPGVATIWYGSSAANWTTDIAVDLAGGVQLVLGAETDVAAGVEPVFVNAWGGNDVVRRGKGVRSH